jgi:hypothetical protein
MALPKFFNKFSEWKNFRHTFESLVISTDTMLNIKVSLFKVERYR